MANDTKKIQVDRPPMKALTRYSKRGKPVAKILCWDLWLTSQMDKLHRTWASHGVKPLKWDFPYG